MIELSPWSMQVEAGVVDQKMKEIDITEHALFCLHLTDSYYGDDIGEFAEFVLQEAQTTLYAPIFDDYADVEFYLDELISKDLIDWFPQTTSRMIH